MLINYDDNTDNYDYNTYDLNEVFGQKPVHIEGDNPFCNVTNFGYIDKKRMANLMRRGLRLEIRGACTTGRDCRFSHNHKLLQEEWTNMNTQLQASRYRPSSSSQHPSFPPKILQRGGAPLRSLSTIEEDQVSFLSGTSPNLSYINNPHRTYHTPPASAQKPTPDQDGRREGNHTV
jgi:hypothetical protein